MVVDHPALSTEALTIETSTIKTADGASLFKRSWLPPSPARASIIIVHGYAEHSGRYEQLAAFFCAMGIAVHAYDHRGAGRSDGRMGRIANYGQLVRDLASFASDHVSDDLPRFLFGQSLGGAITASYLISDDAAPFAGAILTSPAIRIASPIPDPVVRVLRKVAPLAPFLPTVPLDRSALSRDPEVQRDVERDPLAYGGRVSLGTAMQMMNAGDAILAGAHRLDVPLLIVVGTGDTIVEPRGSFELYAAAGTNDKTLAIYEGLYHETFREPEKRAVLDGIRLWIEERLAG